MKDQTCTEPLFLATQYSVPSWDPASMKAISRSGPQTLRLLTCVPDKSKMLEKGLHSVAQARLDLTRFSRLASSSHQASHLALLIPHLTPNLYKVVPCSFS